MNAELKLVTYDEKAIVGAGANFFRALSTRLDGANPVGFGRLAALQMGAMIESKRREPITFKMGKVNVVFSWASDPRPSFDKGSKALTWAPVDPSLVIMPVDEVHSSSEEEAKHYRLAFDRITHLAEAIAEGTRGELYPTRREVNPHMPIYAPEIFSLSAQRFASTIEVQRAHLVDRAS